MKRKEVIIDGNEAAAHIAYKTNDVIAIYPITPASPMGEFSDVWSAEGKKNIWGSVPKVIEMQSEGGAAGAVHGSLMAGSLTTTFTSSQGLLLMLPDMYKIAGELMPSVIHIAARTLATHALSIFCDHSDVMSARTTGYAMLFGSNVQEAMDMALIAHAASLNSRIPFMHIFDGFRTSHEISKINFIDDDVIRKMISEDAVNAHHNRGLTSDNPTLRGTAQNPDTFFQSRERANEIYDILPRIVQETMNDFSRFTATKYNLFEYFGSDNAERVIITMGSSADVVAETISDMDEDVGVVKVRLFRPFSVTAFLQTIPSSVKTITVLDRTKEPGAIGEPLYQDVVTAFSEFFNQELSSERENKDLINENIYFERYPRICGGRYGLSSKEFTPDMVKAIFEEMKKETPKNHFTIGIKDDITHKSLDYHKNGKIKKENEVFQGIFYGLSSDGTVSANKNSIKIIGETTPYFVQGYFEYDSKKAGTRTVSHLRFSKHTILSHYTIESADFIACHNFKFLFETDILDRAVDSGIFLLNTHHSKDKVWTKLPSKVRETIINRSLKFYIIDANKIANEVGLGRRVNTILQACFFALSGVLPKDESISKIKDALAKTYKHKGEKVIQQNFKVVDLAVDNLFQVEVPEISSNGNISHLFTVPQHATDYVKNIVQPIIQAKGNDLPVSSFTIDGTFPTGTSKWEKRGIAEEIPVWNTETCTQCNKCVIICPHAAIQSKVYDNSVLKNAPESFLHTNPIGKEFNQETEAYSLQVSPEDCTGCRLCVEICPINRKDNGREPALLMSKEKAIDKPEIKNWEYFLNLPYIDRSRVNFKTAKGTQLLQPLFEFSGACAGCGETPYLKLLTQLFGDRMVVANATGCSSIYGGNLPTTPWTKNKEGKGPAWANSLFEDNAEFGMGIGVAVNQKREYAERLLRSLEKTVGKNLTGKLLNTVEDTEEGIEIQRSNVAELKTILKKSDSNEARKLLMLADYLCKKSLWIIGGDGWAYDIGFGGLDHVMASGENVNILVMDTEVYSNTGGQTSKATPIGAKAKFSVSGKKSSKKDLGLIAINYENVYVAKIAIGANDTQTIRAIREAEAYSGPSMVIAFAHCIEHGYDMSKGVEQQENAVKSGHWPLYTYNPLKPEGSRFTLNSSKPVLPLKDYMYKEGRFLSLLKDNPERADELLKLAQEEVNKRWEKLEKMKL